MTVVPIPPKNIQGRIRGIGDDVERERTLPQVKNAVVDQGYNKYVDGQAIPAVRVRVGLQADGTYDVRTYDSGGVLIQSLNSIIAGVGADASTTVKGISKLSSPPVSPTNPIAVGDNDPRMTDARAPTAHAVSHKIGGSDQLRLDEFALPTAAVPMNSQIHTGLGAGSANGHSLRYEQLFTTGNVTLLGSLTVKNAKIADWAGGGTYGAFGNQALIGTAGSYAIMQGDGTADNSTYINAKTGGSILFRNNNADVATMDASGFALATGVQLSIPQDAVSGAHAVRLSQLNTAIGNASANRPAVRAISTSTQNLTSGVYTTMLFGSESYDTDGMHSTVSNTDRLTCVTPGTYVVSAGVSFNNTSASGGRLIRILKNGTVIAIQAEPSTSTGFYHSLEITTQVDMVATDYLTVEVYQDSGSTVATQHATRPTYFAASWVGGTGSAWGNSGVNVYKSGAQSSSNATATAITFDAELFDTDGSHDNVTNNSRLTCKIAGKYLVTGHAVWTANNTGMRYAYIRVNGSTVMGYQTTAALTGGYETQVTVTRVLDLNVGDYVELVAEQNSGGTLAFNLGLAGCSFEMVRVGYQTNPNQVGKRAFEVTLGSNVSFVTGGVFVDAFNTGPIAGDGVTSLIIKIQGLFTNTSTGGYQYQIWDGAGGTGTQYLNQFGHGTAAANIPISLETITIPPWTGNKTFYFRANSQLAGGLLYAHSIATCFMRGIWTPV